MTTAERRASPRSRVDLTVHLRSHGDIQAKILTLSRTGALLHASEPLEIGESIQLHLLPGTGEGLDLMARVLRVTAAGSSHEWAVMFSPLTPALGNRLDALVAGAGEIPGQDERPQ